VHGPRLLTPEPEMIAGRASLPGRDHLARLPMIVTAPDRCAIGPVGPTTNNTGTTPRWDQPELNRRDFAHGKTANFNEIDMA